MSSPTRTAINFQDLMHQRARKPLRSPLVKKDRDRPVVQPPVQKTLTSPIPNRGPAAGRPPAGQEAPTVKDGPSFGAWLTGIGASGLQNPRNAQSFKRYVTELYLSKLKGALSQMSQQIQSDIQDPQMARMVMKAIVDTVAGGVGAIAKGEVPDPAQRAASVRTAGNPKGLAKLVDDAVATLLRLGSSEVSSKNVRSALNYIRNAVKNGLDAKQAARDFKSKYPTAFADIMDYIGSYPSAETELRALQMVASHQQENDMKIQETIRELLTAGYKAEAVEIAANLLPSLLTAGRKVKVPEKDVEYEVTCEPAQESIEGNALASGDDAEDKAQEDMIREQLESGNEWAWCDVKVTARWKSWTGVDTLGSCSYTSEADFKAEGYYEDMKKLALESLKANVQHHADEIEAMEREEEATEASVKKASHAGWPTAQEIADDLKHIAADLADDEEGTDVRLQVRDGGDWQLNVGMSDYDTDHHGFWGSSTISRDSDFAAVAADLLDQAEEDHAMADEGSTEASTKRAKLSPQQLGIIEDMLKGMDPSDPAYKMLQEYSKGLKTQGPQKGTSVGVRSLASARKSRIAQRTASEIPGLAKDEADLAKCVKDIAVLEDGGKVDNLTLENAKKNKRALEQCIQNKKKLGAARTAKGLGIQEGTIQTHLDVMKQLADKGDIQGLAKRLKELEADVGRASKGASTEPVVSTLAQKRKARLAAQKKTGNRLTVVKQLAPLLKDLLDGGSTQEQPKNIQPQLKKLEAAGLIRHGKDQEGHLGWSLTADGREWLA